MVLDETLLGPAPESLQTIDIDLSGREIFTVVHLQMPVSAEHEAVVAPELVRVNDTAPANLLDGETQEGFCRDIRNDIHMNDAIPLQDAKNGNLAGSPSPPVALSFAAEIGLVEFDFPSQKHIGILGMAQDGHSNGIDGPIHGLIRHLHLPGHLVDRYFQFKELDDGQPLETTQAPMVDPAAGEVMEGVITSGTAIPSIT
jgi:hypothetical protein